MTGPVEVTADLLRDWPLPEPGEHKNARGRLLVVGGSATTPGAALLAGEAALRAGCGKVQVATSASVAPHLAARFPEARVFGIAEGPAGEPDPAKADQVLELAENADAVLLGPGFTGPETAERFARLLGPVLGDRMVLDAFATSYLGTPGGAAAIATMNPDELRHATGAGEEEIDDEAAAVVRSLASSSGAAVLLGGTSKIIGTAQRTHRVSAGGVGLATAGSGDVQAGLVAGLFARGAPPEQAAVWGAWLHGSAGDLLARKRGSIGLLARELASVVPGLLDQVGGVPS